MQNDMPPERTSELTLFIETRYHQTHRTQLPELATLAQKVERVHVDHPDAPHGLGDLLQGLIGTLEVHIKKEELILFPAIRRGGGPDIESPIAVMRADHDDRDSEVARIRTLTHELTLPESACRTWSALYGGLATFLADLESHIRLENDVLFPRFEIVTR
jgi:regulator of cell morphogenesis and NO signaling